MKAAGGLLAGAIALLLATGCKPAAAPVPRAPSAERGREVFLRGVSPSGVELTAELGPGNVVPAAAIPCAGCHGRDGRGRTEGGLAPSNIRWEALTRPYPVAEGSGRRHPPYDDRLLGRAITMGIDSGNQKLLDGMPRFRLPRADLDDLLAYLRVLGRERDPGLSDEEVLMGAVVPAEGSAAEEGRSAREVVAAYFDQVNQRGGVYGRKLVLRSVLAPTASPAREDMVRAFLDGEQPLALVGGLQVEEGWLAALAEEQQVPLIGARARYPDPAAHQTFFQTGGLAEHGEALASVAAKERPGARVLLLRPDESGARAAARRVAARCRELGFTDISEAAAPGGSAAALPDGGAGVVFLMGWTPEPAFWTALARDPRRPLVLLAGAAPPVMRPEARGKLALRAAAGESPDQLQSEALAALRALDGTYHFSPGALPRQLSALVAARLAVEALERSGRETGRERLVDVLEDVRGFQTGQGPALSFGRNRHVGARGAYLIRADSHGQPAGVAPEWISAR